MKKLMVILVCLGLVGCATVSNVARIGSTDARKLVVLGEHISGEAAKEYATKYDSLVFYSPSRGAIADAISSSLRGTLGPSSAMKHLIAELKSMNNTTGNWELVIPGIAGRYFLVTLKNMEDGDLSEANGTIYLIDCSDNEAIEAEIQRVSNGAFTVEFKE